MPDYTALKTEIQNDPLALGYTGKTDAQVATLLNNTNRPVSVSRTIVASYEVYEAIDPTEWAALSTANKQSIQDLLGMGQVNAAGTRTRALFGSVFGAATTSRANLLALTTQNQARTRAQEIFGAAVTDQDVNWARSH